MKIKEIEATIRISLPGRQYDYQSLRVVAESTNETMEADLNELQQRIYACTAEAKKKAREVEADKGVF